MQYNDIRLTQSNIPLHFHIGCYQLVCANVIGSYLT